MNDDPVRIRPAFWSPRVWPWILLALFALGPVAFCFLTLRISPPDFLWIFPGLAWLIVAWRLGPPVVVLRRDRIEFTTWTEDDDFELGAFWRRRRRDAKRVVLAASRVGSWSREGLRVRLRFPDPLSPSIRFSIAGIHARDRERILAWLEAELGD